MFNYNFEKNDLRRTWLVIGSIDKLERPTITSISKDLNFPKSTVQRIVDRLFKDELPEFEIIKSDDVVLTVGKWGILNKKEVKNFYKNYKIFIDSTP